ncbi:MAG TPA: polysaccharide biosynthesis tyrosine autokinase [Candidatus Acidoferrum sp.]
MADEHKLVPKENGAVEVVSMPPRVPSFDLSPREPHLYDYLLILRKHQWLILSFLLAVVTIVSIATFRMQPVYTTSARIEIDRENSNILPFQGADSYDLMMDMDNYIETQSRILTSETLALQTIRNSGLIPHAEMQGAPAGSEAITSGNLANHKRPPELGAFLGSLSVKRVPNSRLLDVSFEATDPQLAAQILNAHIGNFMEQNFRSRYDTTAKATQWLADQLSDIRVQVQNSEDARLAYEREHQIWNLDDRQNITTQRLSDLNKEVTEAQSDRMRKEALYEFAKAGNLDVVPQLRENVTLQELTKRRSDVYTAYLDALNQYGPNFPKVRRMQAQLKDIDDLLDEQKRKILQTLEIEYNAAQQREALLNDALNEQKGEVNLMAESMVEYNILKRQADANKTMYDGLLTKLKEANIAAGLKSSNIRVVDPAMVPSTPSRPAKTKNIALSFLVGLVGGIGLALLREYMDNTVKTPDDIESLARLPALAVVPAFTGENGAGLRGRFLNGSDNNGHEKRIELVAQHLPKSQMSEAFRALRTALLLSQADHPPQVILVTSALPREGKTTAAANLAVTLAQLGDRTLLVDADLRKPGVGRLLNMTEGKYAGLSSYLAGVSSLDSVIVPHSSIANLVAIPTGPLPPNPADLLSSHRLADALRELRSQFKFIVIDSPPIMAATDAVILSVLADGVLLVVRSGETPKEAFTRARDLLASVKCRLLGVVLNAVDASAPDYYYSYRYYPYSYGYGPQESAEIHEVEDQDSVEQRSSRYSNDDSQSL